MKRHVAERRLRCQSWPLSCSVSGILDSVRLEPPPRPPPPHSPHKLATIIHTKNRKSQKLSAHIENDAKLIVSRKLMLQLLTPAPFLGIHCKNHGFSLIASVGVLSFCLQVLTWGAGFGRRASRDHQGNFLFYIRTEKKGGSKTGRTTKPRTTKNGAKQNKRAKTSETPARRHKKRAP